MYPTLEFALVSFSLIFFIVDPIGNIPIFLSLTEGAGPRSPFPRAPGLTTNFSETVIPDSIIRHHLGESKASAREHPFPGPLPLLGFSPEPKRRR